VLFRRLFSFGMLAAVVGCGVPALENLPSEYVRDLDELGYIAVYPPRSDFRVGSVYFRAHNPENRLDPLDVERVFIGYVAALQSAEAIGAVQRPSFNETVAANQNQSDFSANRSVAGSLRGEPTNDLPPIASPIVTAYGGGVLGIPGLGLGAQSSVYIQFHDARRSSAEINSAARFAQVIQAVQDDYCGPDLNALVALTNSRGIACSNLHNPLEHLTDRRRVCDIVVVTEALYTRRIDYTVTNARGFNAAGGAPAANRPDIDLTVTIDSETPSDLAGSIAQVLAAEPTADGFGAAAAQGTQFGFREQFSEPVAFAFDGVSFDPANQCN